MINIEKFINLLECTNHDEYFQFRMYIKLIIQFIFIDKINVIYIKSLSLVMEFVNIIKKDIPTSSKAGNFFLKEENR